MNTKTPRRRVLALTLAATAAIALGACGDDDEETTTTPTDAIPTGATGAEGESDSGTGAGVISPELEDALRSNLTDVQGLTDSQADCAIDYIVENAGDELAQAGETGEVSDNLSDVSFDAGVECADE